MTFSRHRLFRSLGRRGGELHGIARQLWANRFVRSVNVLISGSVLGNLILLAAMPLVTRLYQPSDLGIFAVVNGLVGIMLGASSMRYEFAIPLPRSEWNARILVLLALVLNAVVALVLAVVIFFQAESIAELLNNSPLVDVLWMLPIVLLGAGSYRAFQYWAIREHNFRSMATTKIMQSLSNAGVQIVGGVAGTGAIGLIIAQFFGYSAGTFTLARGIHFRELAQMRGTLGLRMRVLARRYNRFPKFDVPASLANTTSLQLPNILLASLFSPAAAGFYLLAMRVFDGPLAVIGESIGRVLYARSREAVASGTIATTVVRIVSFLAILVALPAALVFIMGEPIFAIIFGETWREAGVYGSWLIIGSAVQFLYYPISVVLMATNGQDTNLYIHLCLLVIRVAAILFGYWWGSALDAIIGLTVANAFGYLAAVAVTIRHARRHTIDSRLHLT